MVEGSQVVFLKFQQGFPVLLTFEVLRVYLINQIYFVLQWSSLSSPKGSPLSETNIVDISVQTNLEWMGSQGVQNKVIKEGNGSKTHVYL